MNKIEFKQFIDRIEKTYDEVWELLSSLKKHPCKSFMKIQPLLCDTQFELSREYRNIYQTKKKLIGRKEELSQKWFRNRQKLLSERQKTIIEISGIGRSMGDAFTWIFYHNDRKLLEEHAKHELNVHMPPGFGGIGEKEFVAKVFRIGELMVLYHGITTQLRIGDISLIDLKHLKVAGIGELKTNLPENGTLSIHILMQFQANHLPQNIELKTTQKETGLSKFPEQMKSRFNRQMKRMHTMLSEKSKKPEQLNTNKTVKFHHTKFEQLLKKTKLYKCIFGQFDKGLVYAIYHFSNKRLSHRACLKKTNISNKLSGITPNIKEIVLKGSEFNNVTIGSLLYTTKGMPNFPMGTMPLFWWPIDSNLLKKIIFKEFIIITIFNPAHLLTALKEYGFKVTKKQGSRLDFILTKKIGKKHQSLDNVWFFFELISNTLITENEMFNTIVHFLEKIEDHVSDNGKRYKYDFRLNYHY